MKQKRRGGFSLRFVLTFIISFLLVMSGHIMYSNAPYIASPAIGSGLVIALFGSLLIHFLWKYDIALTVRDKVQQTTTHNDESLEKRKRDRIDDVLRELSDDDLDRLRDRLSDGTVNEDNLRYMLTDDGELMVDER